MWSFLHVCFLSLQGPCMIHDIVRPKLHLRCTQDINRPTLHIRTSPLKEGPWEILFQAENQSNKEARGEICWAPKSDAQKKYSQLLYLVCFKGTHATCQKKMYRFTLYVYVDKLMCVYVCPHTHVNGYTGRPSYATWRMWLPWLEEF